MISAQDIMSLVDQYADAMVDIQFCKDQKVHGHQVKIAAARRGDIRKALTDAHVILDNDKQLLTEYTLEYSRAIEEAAFEIWENMGATDSPG